MRRLSRFLVGGLLYVALTGASILMSFPLFWMVSTSLKSLEEANAPRIIWIPSQVLVEAYRSVLADPDFIRAYVNSAFYAALALAGTLLSIAAVAYAFSRLNWPGKNLVFALMLSTLMIPAQALIVPQYVLFNELRWIGTFNPLIIPGYFAGGAAMVFLLRQAMAQIPRELDESAFIDGASHLQIWWEITLPLIKAPLATVATFLFVAYWNNLLGPLLYAQSTKLYTLPVYVATLYNINNTVQPWPSIMAAAVLTTVPLFAVFFFAQRFILESVVVSGLKG
ncbi:MAG TPA: carbohydrate ABC transporter permease [Anaerolineales bacterium]|nr:carbohydrate ABC transporter permease [Anaerolineales bacterium]